jgi:MFS family permease
MAKEFALGATEKGVVAAASLFGILIGAATLGGLADRYGRKQMFIVEMVLFGIFTVLLTLSSSYPLVLVGGHLQAILKPYTLDADPCTVNQLAYAHFWRAVMYYVHEKLIR